MGVQIEDAAGDGERTQGPRPAPSPSKELRHYPRRTFTGAIEIIDRQFDFVRAILPYDYAFTSNAQSMDEANRICIALEGPMSAQGIWRVSEDGVGQGPTSTTDSVPMPGTNKTPSHKGSGE